LASSAQKRFPRRARTRVFPISSKAPLNNRRQPRRFPGFANFYSVDFADFSRFPFDAARLI
jgi:hypothetical protein